MTFVDISSQILENVLSVAREVDRVMAAGSVENARRAIQENARRADLARVRNEGSEPIPISDIA
jgi:hypothetical protein